MQSDVTPIDDRLRAIELQTDHDPFSDDEPLKSATSSKVSIRSFWICIAGLAVMAHLAIYLESLMRHSVDDWFRWYFDNLKNSRWHYEARYAMRVVSSQSFVPCLILATVVPILYWRGGLAHRFVVALAIVIATMNNSVSPWGRSGNNPTLCFLAISSCWMMFPLLFLLTPIRTERLRLIVASLANRRS